MAKVGGPTKFKTVKELDYSTKDSMIYIEDKSMINSDDFIKEKDLKDYFITNISNIHSC